MASEWTMRPFADCATLLQNSVSAEACRGQPYIGLEHIQKDGLRLLSVGSGDEVTSTKTQFHQGDILFGKLRPYFRKLVHAPFSGVCSTDIWVVRAKEGIEQRFLYYWMASPSFVNAATRGSKGTKMPRADWDFVGKEAFLVPSLKIQRRIARILGTLDDKIELNQRMNQTLEKMAAALFKSWFVDFDPVHTKAEGHVPDGMSAAIAALFPREFEDSELGLIPKGWQVRSLDSLATYLNGPALQKFPAESDNEYLPAIKIAQLRAGNTIGADRASARLKSEYVVRDGDVLFSWSGSLEVEFWCGGDGALNQHLFKVTSDEVPKWLYYLATRHFLPNFREIAANKATTMGHIQRKHLTEAKIALPPASLISELGRLAAPVLERRVSNAIQARELARLRDTLLPRLISGKLRLPEAKAQAEEAIA